MAKIETVRAREILDSRGFPTVEATVVTATLGQVGRLRLVDVWRCLNEATTRADHRAAGEPEPTGSGAASATATARTPSATTAASFTRHVVGQ